LLLTTQVMVCAATPGVETARVGGVPIRIFLCRPAHCRPQALLFVFHGQGRNEARRHPGTGDLI